MYICNAAMDNFVNGVSDGRKYGNIETKKSRNRYRITVKFQFGI